MAFSFRKFAVQPEQRARYVLDTVSDDPARPITLILRHAGDSNPAYASAVIKKINERRGRSGLGKVTATFLQSTREDEVELFANCVVAGWENVIEDGKPAECTPDSVKRFLASLAAPAPDGCPEVFAALVRFASDPDNFRAPIADSEALGKA